MGCSAGRPTIRACSAAAAGPAASSPFRPRRAARHAAARTPRPTTSTGCLANGEPIGASGLRQVHEICAQLRGQGGARQVPNVPKTGYTHVYGAPGLSGVTITSR